MRILRLSLYFDYQLLLHAKISSHFFLPRSD